MIELPIIVKNINKKLKKLYGNAKGSHNQLYRIVFSENERENRRGTFNVFSGIIFLKTVTGVRNMKKYPYIQNKFVLEKWNPPEIAYSPELPESIHGCYEPLYTFEDKDKNALPVNEKVAFMVCFANAQPYDYWKRKNEMEEAEAKRNKEEYEDLYFGVPTSDNPFNASLNKGTVGDNTGVILTDQN